MRYRAAKKLEIIRFVEQSSLPVRRTLAQLENPRATFYRWYQCYLAHGGGAPRDGQPALCCGSQSGYPEREHFLEDYLECIAD